MLEIATENGISPRGLGGVQDSELRGPAWLGFAGIPENVKGRGGGRAYQGEGIGYHTRPPFQSGNSIVTIAHYEVKFLRTSLPEPVTAYQVWSEIPPYRTRSTRWGAVPAAQIKMLALIKRG